MKSVPFRLLHTIPYDVCEKHTIQFDDGCEMKITKIKSVKFLDMRTIEVIGLAKPIEGESK